MVKYSLFSLILSCLVWSSATAQVVVLGTKDGGRIAGFDFAPGDLVRYDMDTGTASLFSSESIFDDIGIDINLDALHVWEDGSFAFSSRLTVSLDDQRYIPREIVTLNPLRTEATPLYEGPSDISGFDILSNGIYLLSTKVNATIGGQDYAVGDVIRYNPNTGESSLFFSNSNFFTVAEGGSWPKGNIDAIDVLPNGNMLFSTTNTAEIGTTVENAVTIFQAGMYEYNFTTGSVTTFLEPSVFQSNSVDLKAFSVLLPPALLGDCNSDGTVDFLDVTTWLVFFVAEIYLQQADCNSDGVVNFFDIVPFLQILTAD